MCNEYSTIQKKGGDCRNGTSSATQPLTRVLNLVHKEEEQLWPGSK